MPLMRSRAAGSPTGYPVWQDVRREAMRTIVEPVRTSIRSTDSAMAMGTASKKSHLRTMHPASRERERLEKKNPDLKPDVTDISPAEWTLLRVLWTEGTATARRLSRLLLDRWSGSTVKTLLARLERKGIVRAEKEPSVRGYVYHPLITEIDAATQRAEAVFGELCAHCRGKVLLSVLEKTALSKPDIEKIQTELDKKEGDAPESIPCDCEKDCATDPDAD